VCTSIPSEKYSSYSNYIRQKGNVGNGVLYAYLSYAKSIDQENEEIRTSILNLLYDQCTNKSFAPDNTLIGTESPFEEEVVIELTKHIESGRIELQHSCGGFRIDFVVKSKRTGKPVIAIECDGAKYHSSNEAYAWDMFRQEQLENQGFVFHRIWSTNWWNNTEKEIKQLIEFIHQFDLEESKQEIRQIELEPYLVDFNAEEIRPETKEKKKVTQKSIVTIRNQDSLVFRVKFTKTQSKHPIKIIPNQVTSINVKSPLAVELMGREEGEQFQLGMFEVYYEILKVE
jgi:very-short-patch-repair endonuclease